jgi:hypothetical protein
VASLDDPFGFPTRSPCEAYISYSSLSVDAGIRSTGCAAAIPKDLSERWMYYDDPLERHHKCKIFRGRIAELQCAAWLETLNWAVTDLEALREGPDIVATSPELRDVAVEVKFIGTEDDDFKSILRSLAGQPAARFASAYSGVNYLLFRIYEGAKQLARSYSAKQRMVVAIVDALGWEGFELQLENEWINWKEPKFLGADPGWEKFLESQRQRYPPVLDDLPSTIGGLDRIWIVRQSSGFKFHLEFERLHPGD